MKQGSDGEYRYEPWPSWATSPDGEQRIFDSEAEVPAGWKHHGVVKGKSAPKAEKPVGVAEPATDETASENEVDAEGTAWNPELHAATKTKTSAGLWRMKVGVARPPKLDL